MRTTILLFACCILFNSCSTSELEPMAQGENVPNDTIQYNVPWDFKLEALYHPSHHNQGTWVALAEGKDGTFYACDQKGPIYQFRMPEPGVTLDSTMVDSLDLGIGFAHGLLWAFNSLYVVVNRHWPDEEEIREKGAAFFEDFKGSGIYRLTDTNGDDQLDQVEMIIKLEGAGEHGPHNLLLSPDSTELYFIAGNQTTIPDIVTENSRVPKVWGEDNLFPPFLDARGHANDLKAPGGWIAKMDPEGNSWALISAGYRNPFDIAFNKDGELFTFDADMEWDFGMPWYRPIRICHATSGSSFGWRTGSGKWPVYYPDNLPPVMNLGQGSPTTLLSGAKLNFPDRYTNGLLAFDWSFGTVYFLDLQAVGSSYSATAEEFFSGIPMPLTDAIVGSDGNLYFATGGRDLESRLYRLSYRGTFPEPREYSPEEDAKALRGLRHTLERFHHQITPEAIPMAWEHLNHSDRFIRFAARVALEHQPWALWQERLTAETDPDRVIQATIALARHGQADLQTELINKLSGLPYSKLSKPQKLDLLRAYALLLIRMGKPDGTLRDQLVQALNGHFPSGEYDLDREISQLLIFLEDEEATAKCLELLDKHTREKTMTHPELISDEVAGRSEDYGPQIQEMLKKMPPTEATFYGTLLSRAETGWTEEGRTQYFQWFFSVLDAKGGMSYKPFLENIRKQAMKQVPEDKKEFYEELSGVYSPMEEMANLPQPKGPGKEYNFYDLNHILGEDLENYQGKIQQGKMVYEAALCGTCHRMQGEGGSMGPDLTQLYTRFDKRDMINAVFSPNDEISDQYAFTLFHLKDGKKTAGRILSENDSVITIMQNPYSTTFTTQLAKGEVVSQSISPVSPMPPGLLNRLNAQEVLDLFAYLLSGGDPEHYYYGGEKGKPEEPLD